MKLLQTLFGPRRSPCSDGSLERVRRESRVEFKTPMGGFTLELYPDKAPRRRELLQYAQQCF